MKFFLLPFVALGASLLTFFSGFGLGTLLTPAFAIFFPIDISIALTAVVHLLNNLFKVVLIGKQADRRILVRFGVPALLASFLGARVLYWVGKLPALWSYSLYGKMFSITPIKTLVGMLLVGFVFIETNSRLQKLSLPRKYLPLGGVLSGLFGGLSGNQGALRTVFLNKLGLSKEAFVATGVLIACLVDVSRLSLYLTEQLSLHVLRENASLLVLATGAAFAGAYAGSQVLTKMTISGIKRIVSAALILFGLALILGWV